MCVLVFLVLFCCLFFFNDTATTEIYTLSLHDALPISVYAMSPTTSYACSSNSYEVQSQKDRKSGSAGMPRPISYAVFCLNKKKNQAIERRAAPSRPPPPRVPLHAADRL